MEIGSEFSSVPIENGAGISFPKNGCLTFSGRTAIETVLKEIPHAKTALLPSYCCDSVIEPFRRADISVSFYDVNYQNGLKIDLSQRADILFWCNYFGFSTEMPQFDGIIIEDITHSLLSDIQYNPISDYWVASLRKWEPIYCGGYCSVNTKLNSPPNEFIISKAEAMSLKAKYLSDSDERKKERFLSEFGKSNKWLAENYFELGIDEFSKNYIEKVCIERQKEIRRKNAHVLYEGLKNRVDFLFDEQEMDCPIYVPIVINKDRLKIRTILTENEIYCPIHWPHPNADCKSNLYDLELSLICDQRYSEDDMERIVSVILKNI